MLTPELVENQLPRILHPMEVQYYQQLWLIATNEQTINPSTVLSGRPAFDFLSKATNLDKTYLKQIWALSDYRGKGALNLMEFVVCLRLIYQAQCLSIAAQHQNRGPSAQPLNVQLVFQHPQIQPGNNTHGVDPRMLQLPRFDGVRYPLDGAQGGPFAAVGQHHQGTQHHGGQQHHVSVGPAQQAAMLVGMQDDVQSRRTNFGAPPPAPPRTTTSTSVSSQQQPSQTNPPATSMKNDAFDIDLSGLGGDFAKVGVSVNKADAVDVRKEVGQHNLSFTQQQEIAAQGGVSNDDFGDFQQEPHLGTAATWSSFPTAADGGSAFGFSTAPQPADFQHFHQASPAPIQPKTQQPLVVHQQEDDNDDDWGDFGDEHQTATGQMVEVKTGAAVFDAFADLVEPVAAPAPPPVVPPGADAAAPHVDPTSPPLADPGPRMEQQQIGNANGINPATIHLPNQLEFGLASPPPGTAALNINTAAAASDYFASSTGAAGATSQKISTAPFDAVAPVVGSANIPSNIKQEHPPTPAKPATPPRFDFSSQDFNFFEGAPDPDPAPAPGGASPKDSSVGASNNTTKETARPGGGTTAGDEQEQNYNMSGVIKQQATTPSKTTQKPLKAATPSPKGDVFSALSGLDGIQDNNSSGDKSNLAPMAMPALMPAPAVVAADDEDDGFGDFSSASGPESTVDIFAAAGAVEDRLGQRGGAGVAGSRATRPDVFTAAHETASSSFTGAPGSGFATTSSGFTSGAAFASGAASGLATATDFVAAATTATKALDEDSAGFFGEFAGSTSSKTAVGGATPAVSARQLVVQVEDDDDDEDDGFGDFTSTDPAATEPAFPEGGAGAAALVGATQHDPPPPTIPMTASAIANSDDLFAGAEFGGTAAAATSGTTTPAPGAPATVSVDEGSSGDPFAAAGVVTTAAAAPPTPPGNNANASSPSSLSMTAPAGVMLPPRHGESAPPVQEKSSLGTAPPTGVPQEGAPPRPSSLDPPFNIFKTAVFSLAKQELPDQINKLCDELVKSCTAAASGSSSSAFKLSSSSDVKTICDKFHTATEDGDLLSKTSPSGGALPNDDHSESETKPAPVDEDPFLSLLGMGSSVSSSSSSIGGDPAHQSGGSSSSSSSSKKPLGSSLESVTVVKSRLPEIYRKRFEEDRRKWFRTTSTSSPSSKEDAAAASTAIPSLEQCLQKSLPFFNDSNGRARTTAEQEDVEEAVPEITVGLLREIQSLILPFCYEQQVANFVYLHCAMKMPDSVPDTTKPLQKLLKLQKDVVLEKSDKETQSLVNVLEHFVQAYPTREALLSAKSASEVAEQIDKLRTFLLGMLHMPDLLFRLQFFCTASNEAARNSASEDLFQESTRTLEKVCNFLSANEVLIKKFLTLAAKNPPAVLAVSTLSPPPVASEVRLLEQVLERVRGNVDDLESSKTKTAVSGQTSEEKTTRSTAKNYTSSFLSPFQISSVKRIGKWNASSTMICHTSGVSNLQFAVDDPAIAAVVYEGKTHHAQCLNLVLLP
ncbi:unnamed protein product [Amoebophrya sp. A120]|nr:unnamed protein product [Amoebophrya sp. A120]|eukprot:GSA120T00013364001.1